ncbi:MAG: amino acid ABC transporter substrate-binding protein [Anaerolineae bacterium]|nr:amino acid ABC transporter substrate-binding protein [Anaerolineae bacterium]MCX8068510.1 amino acid ABC transporter substrate-binding protein [Anaerolineae bacterium]MDW7991800.1 amino acid ABC transporter substrate-binding protein [Anaerolineae bacterium]
MTTTGWTRREFLRGVAVAGAGLALAACAPRATPKPAKDKIVVGMSRPLSGPLAQVHEAAFKPVYETFVKEVNDAGGIYVEEYGKKLPIELIIYDDKSDVGTATRLTEKLILEDKVDFLWPGCGTSYIYAQAPIANKYGYILITAEGGATTLKDMLPSMPYVFVTLSFSDWYQLPVLAELLAEKGAKTAYIAYIADLHGIEYSGVAGIEFPKRGISIIGTKSIPPDMKDLSPIIREAKAADPDVFCCFGYPDQVMPATALSIELDFNPKAWVGGPCVNFGFYQTTFGPAAEGVIGFTSFNPKQSDAARALAEKLYAGKPKEIQDYWGHPLYWAGLEVWKQAIERAGTLDQAKIRDIIATQRFQTVLGETWFENGLLSKDCHTGEIGQWINGEYEVIGPKKWATAEMVYPKPKWPKG